MATITYVVYQFTALILIALEAIEDFAAPSCETLMKRREPCCENKLLDAIGGAKLPY